MATLNIAETIKATGWGDRRSSLLMDTMVRNSAFLSRLTLVDGVKSKALIPTYDASLTYGSNLCDLTDGTGGSLDLGEKEVAVKDYTWYFSNCKKSLETTYRSLMLRKGTMNEQTLDDDLKDWLLTHFGKLNGAKAMTLASAEIMAEIKADSQVNKVTTSKTSVLEILDDMYKAIPQDLLDILYGEADRDIKPVIFMNSNMIRDYQMEVAKKDVISYNGISKGEIPTYMGMEIVNFSTLPDGAIIIAQPNNLLLVCDDFGDVKSIQTEYDKKKNSDEWFGSFKIGFSYRYGKYMVVREAATFRSK